MIRPDGKVKAVVLDINDPKKMRKIKVTIPQIGSDSESDWALPDDGITEDWLPKVGDYVWVEWENNNFQGDLIYTGKIAAGPDIDPDFIKNTYDKSDQENHLYRKKFDYNGNQIEWTPDGIKITTAAGAVIDLTKNDDDEKIDIKFDNDFFFLLDKKNNIIKSQIDNDHKIHIDKANSILTAQVDADYSIVLDKSGQKGEIKANGNTILMDSTGTDINGGKLFIPK